MAKATPKPADASTQTQPQSPNQIADLWLDIGNVRLDRDVVAVQFKADRSDERERRWWRVEITDNAAGAASRTYKQISDALESKRTVLGRLAAANEAFLPVWVRIQFGS